MSPDAPMLRPSFMRRLGARGSREVRERLRFFLVRAWRLLDPVLTIVLTALATAILLATIFLTSQDVQWLAFLGGVLFAGIVAVTSQASRMAWRLARRDAQLERYKQRLAESAAAAQSARQAAVQAQAHARTLLDALPDPVLCVDRDLRCRQANAAAQRFFTDGQAIADGEPLGRVLEDEACRRVKARVLTAFDGRIEPFELRVSGAAGTCHTFDVVEAPHPAVNAESMYLIFGSRDEARRGAPTYTAVREPLEDGAALYAKTVAEHFISDEAERQRLVASLHDNAFMLFGQGIACLHPSLPEAACCEVLLRLREEEQNRLPPGSFLPAAEQYGLMGEIDRWVVAKLVTECIECVKRLPGWRLPLCCVNLSYVSIADPDFALFVRHESVRPGFEPRALCLEIDESDALAHPREVRTFAAVMKARGCRIAIDGFGRGKVSFDLLKSMAPDFVKLDGRLVQNILHSPADMAKAKAIVAVCERLGARTIALFVESKELADALAAIGVDYLQGFGIAEPQPLQHLLKSGATIVPAPPRTPPVAG